MFEICRSERPEAARRGQNSPGQRPCPELELQATGELSSLHPTLRKSQKYEEDIGPLRSMWNGGLWEDPAQKAENEDLPNWSLLERPHDLPTPPHTLQSIFHISNRMISHCKASLVTPLLKILGDCDVNSVKFAVAYTALQGLSCLLPLVTSHSVVHALCSLSVLESSPQKLQQVISVADNERFVKFFTRLVPFYSSCLRSSKSFYLLLVSITTLLVLLSLLLSSCCHLICIFCCLPAP